jgi:transcriptional regulator with XRE-family HTH domain
MPSRERARHAALNPKPPHVELGWTEIRRLAEVVKRAVAEHGTREAASRALGVGSSTLSKIANARAPFNKPPEVVDALAAYAGVSREDLLAGRSATATKGAA